MIHAFFFRYETLLGALLICLLFVARGMAPEFTTVETQSELLRHVWETALLTLPLTLILISGGIDLSIGSIMALCAVVLGMAFEAGLSPYVGALLALLTGLGAGALNGVFVAYVRVHPLIVTLATLAAYRGVAEGISLGRPISGFPPGFVLLGQGDAAGVVFAFLALAAALALARTSGGLSLYAMGYNETASRFSGIAVDRIKLLRDTLSGAAWARAAVFFVARRNTAKADIGQGIELDVIAMVVLGGTSVFGGRGGIIGTVLGILLIHETREFVGWQWSRDELNLIVLGALLILSVLAHRLFLPRGEKSRRNLILLIGEPAMTGRFLSFSIAAALALSLSGCAKTSERQQCSGCRNRHGCRVR